MGPRKADDGNWLSHSLLGEVEDYEEMERELGIDNSHQGREAAEEDTKVVNHNFVVMGAPSLTSVTRNRQRKSPSKNKPMRMALSLLKLRNSRNSLKERNGWISSISSNDFGTYAIPDVELMTKLIP
jgi:hypothetical protein